MGVELSSDDVDYWKDKFCFGQLTGVGQNYGDHHQRNGHQGNGKLSK